MFNNLRRIRKEKGISPTELAEEIGVNVQTYYKKESGKLKTKIGEAKKIASKLGMNVEEIFFEDDCSILESSAS